MAKRKAAKAPRKRSGQASRKAAGGRKTTSRSRTTAKKAKKATRRKRSASKGRAAAKSAKKAQKKVVRARAAKRPAKRPAKQPAPKAASSKAAKPTRSRPAAKATRKTVARSAPPAAPQKRPPVPVLRKPPALDRERRVVRDEDEDPIQATPPSSLDLNRTASAARTGRRSLKDRFDAHTETSPALTGGDVDADWESAYSVGDEAPGGDNPTPDQDIVDEIGRAVGVEYQDNEELKGDEKIAKRDRNRWELDPASSDDWDDR